MTMGTQERFLNQLGPRAHESDEISETKRGGFVTEYWTNAEEWPRLSPAQRGIDCFRRAVATIIALPFPAVVTVLAFALSLFLLSGLYLLLKNVEQVVSSLGGRGLVSVFLDPEIDDAGVAALLERVRSRPFVTEAKYISKTDALEEFRAMLGQRATILEGVDAESVLPASLELGVKADEESQRELKTLVAQLQQNPQVSEVVMGGAWVERLQDGLRFVRVGGIVLLLLVLSVVCFLIGNTIRLALFAKRDELQVLRLVGAPESFIANPLILAGVLQGAVGALCGIAFLWVAWIFVAPNSSEFSIFGVSLGMHSFLSPTAIVFCLVFGMLVGLIGSALAVRLTLHESD